MLSLSQLQTDDYDDVPEYEVTAVATNDLTIKRRTEDQVVLTRIITNANVRRR